MCKAFITDSLYIPMNMFYNCIFASNTVKQLLILALSVHIYQEHWRKRNDIKKRRALPSDRLMSGLVTSWSAALQHPRGC